jgi:hypothetical protein
MFQTDLLSIIRSLNTLYTAIGICHTSYVDCLLARSGCSILTSLANTQYNYYDKYLLRVYSVEILLMMDSRSVQNM